MGVVKMFKKWMGVALLAGWLGRGGVATAQSLPHAGVPTPPDPLPCGPDGAACPAPGPNLVPGPLSPLAAPPGPPDKLGLPPDVPGAFPCDEPCPPPAHTYFHIGTQALQRQ